MSSGFQLLKSPASDTFRALGAAKVKGIEVGAALLPSSGFFMLNSFFVL
jgi:hypothetical protein